jgi:glycosyltransferase involved in cell wall biosynthesis
MRVAHIVNSLTKASGISAFCMNITQNLAELDVDIDLYVWWIGDDALLPNHERINIYETRKNGFKPAIKPDLLHIHALWAPISHQGCNYARLNGVPYIISPHGMLTPWALKQNWWKKLFGLAFYQYRDLKASAMLHATAQSEVDDIRSLKLLQDIAIVPLGAKLPELHEVHFDDALHELQPDSGIILFLSRIHQKKGLDNLFRAWADLKITEKEISEHSSSKHWLVVIAGPSDSDYKASLIRLGKSLGISIKDFSSDFSLSKLSELSDDVEVVFTGPLYGTEKEQLHRLADLFVLPSFSENFGVVVSDSLAYGVPVITTKGTPWEELEGERVFGNMQKWNTKVDEIIASGRCGWWIDIGREPLANALREAIEMTDEERRAMGINGRRLVERKYTWPVVAGEMQKAYERMMNVEYPKNEYMG